MYGDDIQIEPGEIGCIAEITGKPKLIGLGLWESTMCIKTRIRVQNGQAEGRRE